VLDPKRLSESCGREGRVRQARQAEADEVQQTPRGTGPPSLLSVSATLGGPGGVQGQKNTPDRLPCSSRLSPHVLRGGFAAGPEFPSFPFHFAPRCPAGDETARAVCSSSPPPPQGCAPGHACWHIASCSVPGALPVGSGPVLKFLQATRTGSAGTKRPLRTAQASVCAGATSGVPQLPHTLREGMRQGGKQGAREGARHPKAATAYLQASSRCEHALGTLR